VSDSILVRVTLDSYDVVHPQQKQTQVYVQIPEVARASWLLPEDTFHHLKDRAWPEVLDALEGHITYGNVASPSAWKAAWAAIQEWMRDSVNRDEMQAAFEADCARRDPVTRKLLARVAELKAERADRRDELALALGRDSGSEWGDLIEFAAGAVSVETKLRARIAELEGGLPAMQEALFRALDRVSALEAERHSTNEALDDAVQELRGRQPGAEVFVPQTERSLWVAIAEALNAAHAAGMPMGIDLDGTLTDHQAWSVVWDRSAGWWTVAGYDDEEPDGITRVIAPTQALQPESDAPALTIHRALWDTVPLGLYTTVDAARAHCEDHARRDLPTAAVIDWVTDEDDGVAELVATVDGEQSMTGYTVVPLEVAAEYDAEADE